MAGHGGSRVPASSQIVSFSSLKPSYEGDPPVLPVSGGGHNPGSHLGLSARWWASHESLEVQAGTGLSDMGKCLSFSESQLLSL